MLGLLTLNRREFVDTRLAMINYHYSTVNSNLDQVLLSKLRDHSEDFKVEA